MIKKKKKIQEYENLYWYRRLSSRQKYTENRRKFNVPYVIICDTAHQIEHGGAETIIVEKGADSVDFRLVNLIQKDDIAITQDYGLAAMCLSKRTIVLN